MPHLAELSAAVWEERRLEVRYREPDGEVGRAARPARPRAQGGVWYLVALSGRTRSLRTFRVSRVVGVKELDEEALRPDGFDLAAHWGEAGTAFFETMARIEVRVRMRGDRSWALRHILDRVAAQAAQEDAGPPDAEGWVEVTLRMELLEQAARELLRFGGDLEVLEPLELRQQMAATAASMNARYGVA